MGILSKIRKNVERLDDVETISANINTLIRMDAEFEQLRDTNPGVSLLLRKKMGLFYSNNGPAIDSARREMEEIKEKYLVKDEDGKSWKTSKNEKGELTFQFQDGKNDEDFVKEMKVFVEQECNIII